MDAMSQSPLLSTAGGLDDTTKERDSFDDDSPIVSAKPHARALRLRQLAPSIITNLLLLAVIGLLAINISSTAGWSKAAAGDSRNIVHGVYGTDWSYMSLDHKYDSLWDGEFAGNNGILNLPPYDGQKHQGAIGM